jgi:protein arginine N-methyltransferase 5
VVPGNFEEAEETYAKYMEFKQLCGHFPGIQLILDLQADLPSWEKFNERWTGDKIYAIQLDTSIFTQNTKGFPVLSKKHQETCKRFMKQQTRFILRSRHPNDSINDHYQYLCYLFKNHDNLDQEEKIEINYRNYLQSPLQPLADNLESSTYETFENDTIKYDIYEESLYKAFLDKKKYGRFLQTKKP